MQTCVTLEFVFTMKKSGLNVRETNSDQADSDQAILDQAILDQVGEDKMA